MTSPSDLTRRSLFAVSGVGAGALLLSGCSSDGASDSGSSSKDTPGASGSESAITLSSIPVGGGISAKHNGAPIVVEQPTAGTVVAFSAICPHQGCVVAPQKSIFACPCHGSQFDGATGAVERGPAPRGLTKLTATVDGNTVTIS